MKLAGWLAAVLAGLSPAVRAAPASWPQVAALNQRVPLAQPVQLALRDAAGQALYRLACTTGADLPLACTLHEEGQPGAGDLLAPAAAGARARGSFRAHDLQGACASYPEFGRQRSFRLRGLQLTLTLEDGAAAGAGPGAAPVRFLRVAVQPDARALAALAEAPGVVDPETPGHSCAVQPATEDPFSCRKPVIEVAKPTCGP